MKATAEQLSTFIHLKDKAFAEYKIIYHINDGYSIKELNRFSSKHQLLFQKFTSKIHQMNLMFIDSIFPIHLADVARATLLNSVSSLQEYSLMQKDFIVISAERDAGYFRIKFYDFILQLLFSNIALEEPFRVESQRENIYYIKNESNEIDYYTYYDQRKLQELLFEKMRLEINKANSSITKDEVTLCLKIFIP